MALIVTGRLHIKGGIEQIKENFSKRDFVLELTDETPSGNVFTNYAKFQLTNNYCSLLDLFQPGQLISVSFVIRGNMFDKNGEKVCYTNLNAWRIEAAEQHAAQYPMQQQAQPQQQEDDLPF